MSDRDDTMYCYSTGDDKTGCVSDLVALKLVAQKRIYFDI